MKHRLIYLLFAGHLVTDLSQGALPALLPFFIAEYGLTYAAAGWLVLAATISSSIVQPVFGLLADRVSKPWFISFGPLLAGVGMVIAGLVHNYYLILFGVSLCGLGVAAFHPEAARMANHAAGEKKASGMSIFSVGGNAGFALGPLITTGLVLTWGLKGMTLYLIPAILIAAVSIRELGMSSKSGSVGSSGQVSAVSPNPDLKDAWIPFILLTGAIICRSILFQGLNTFLPMYWIENFHQSKAVASTALTVLFAMGIIGNLVGGRLADRFGYRRTVLTGFVVMIPLFLIFLSLKNVIAATLILVPLGFTIFTSFSPMIVMGQQYLPGRVGFASGVTIGLAVSVGGFAAPLLGRLADQVGIGAVFDLVAVFPVLAVILVYFLPKTRSIKETKEQLLNG